MSLSAGGYGVFKYVPVFMAWKWFPKSKGLVTGIILMGIGINGVIYIPIVERILNPLEEKSLPNGLYGPEIYNRFPVMYKYLLSIWAVLCIFAIAFVIPPKKSEEPVTQSTIKKTDGTILD